MTGGKLESVWAVLINGCKFGADIKLPLETICQMTQKNYTRVPRPLIVKVRCREVYWVWGMYSNGETLYILVAGSHDDGFALAWLLSWCSIAQPTPCIALHHAVSSWLHPCCASLLTHQEQMQCTRQHSNNKRSTQRQQLCDKKGTSKEKKKNPRNAHDITLPTDYSFHTITRLRQCGVCDGIPGKNLWWCPKHVPSFEQVLRCSQSLPKPFQLQ